MIDLVVKLTSASSTVLWNHFLNHWLVALIDINVWWVWMMAKATVVSTHYFVNHWWGCDQTLMFQSGKNANWYVMIMSITEGLVIVAIYDSIVIWTTARSDEIHNTLLCHGQWGYNKRWNFQLFAMTMFVNQWWCVSDRYCFQSFCGFTRAMSWWCVGGITMLSDGYKH